MAAYDYDVFLSFRTEDNHGFTSDLYRALARRGIRTFAEEDEEQPSWVPIKRSRIAIIVFSEHYASSRKCLDELLNIMECRRTQAQRVWPIFYNVDRLHVHIQMGSYHKAMKRHEQNFGNGDPVLQWKQALAAAANLAGWFNKKAFFEDDIQLIGHIVARVRVAVGAYDHDVFLSFRAADSHGFTTNLKQALEQVGIHTFAEEDEEQPSWAQIQRSWIAIIVFSEDYASSTRRLDELLNIMECHRTLAQLVMPIFYNVDSFHVLLQMGSYHEAMKRHEQNFGNGDPVLQWRQALKAAANLPSRFNKAQFEDDIQLIGQIVARFRDVAGAYDHDVFLSFRAADDHGFTTNLKQALEQAGIRTFAEEDEEQPSWAQIQRSWMVIIVFSKDYASLTRRLDELLKIMECHKTLAQLVMPIFYKVSLSDVRDQGGSFGEAMIRHKESLGGDSDRVLRWRQALTEATLLRGFRRDVFQ